MQGRQQPAKAVSWLNFEPRSQSFPAIKVAIATFIAFATMVYFLCILNSIDFSNLTVKINIMIIRKRGECDSCILICKTVLIKILSQLRKRF